MKISMQLYTTELGRCAILPHAVASIALVIKQFLRMQSCKTYQKQDGQHNLIDALKVICKTQVCTLQLICHTPIITKLWGVYEVP
jgi:hypothetical protein